MLAEEGLEKCWRRHADCAEKLHQGRSIAEAAGINGRSFRATIKFMGPCLFPGCRRAVAADNFQLASGKSKSLDMSLETENTQADKVLLAMGMRSDGSKKGAFESRPELLHFANIPPSAASMIMA